MDIGVLNPYVNRGPITRPEEFWGRGEELADLYQRVLRGMSVALMGERRVGKTSLMNALVFERELYEVPDEVKFVFLDIQGLAGCEESVLLERLLDLIEDQTGIRKVRGGRQDIEATVRAVTEAGMRLIILLDEFNNLVSNKNIPADFYDVLRSVSSRYRVPFVIAYREGTVPDLIEALQEENGHSPFMNIFGVVYVGPFDSGDARTLIHVPSEEAGVTFSEEEEARILGLAGHFPFFLQIACYFAFDGKMKGTLEKGWDRVVERFRWESIHHLHHLWQRLPADEKAVLTASSRNTAPAVSGRARASALSQLRQKGILLKEGGRERVFSSVFEELIAAPEQVSTAARLGR